MKKFLLFPLSFWLLANSAFAENKEFITSSVIHPVVDSLAVPAYPKTLQPVEMVISTSSETAQKHVQMGLALVHGMWDFEAYRHFCAAANADPDCLMAYWGIALALADPNHEFRSQRSAAIERMFDLADAKQGTELERGYVSALGYLFSEDNQVASRAFAKLSEEYPHDRQSALLAAFLRRDGYNEFGEPRFGQEEATRQIKKLLEEHPNDLSVAAFWVMLNAEAQNKDDFLSKEIVTHARKLVRLVPDYPPYQHALGHLEWRIGNHSLAIKAFQKATTLYEEYSKESGVLLYDCPGWMRVQCYLAVAHQSKGDFAKSIEIGSRLKKIPLGENKEAVSAIKALMKEISQVKGDNLATVKANLAPILAKIPATTKGKIDARWQTYFEQSPSRIKKATADIEDTPEGAVTYLRTVLGEVGGVMMEMSRLRSAGAVVCLWEAKTLLARLYFARNHPGDLQLALASFPSKEEVQPLINRSLVIYYYEGLRQYAMTRLALEKKDFTKSQETMQALSHTYMQMNKQSGLATSLPEFSDWVRAKTALAALIPELQGLSVMAGPKAGRKSAFNWFSSAVSKQQRGTLLLPPAIFYPMENRLALYKLDKGANVSAGQDYVKALERFPNDVPTLAQYRDVLNKLGKADTAKKIQAHIDAVKK